MVIKRTIDSFIGGESYLLDCSPFDDNCAAKLKKILLSEDSFPVKLFEFTSVYENEIIRLLPEWLSRIALEWIYDDYVGEHCRRIYFDDDGYRIYDKERTKRWIKYQYNTYLCKNVADDNLFVLRPEIDNIYLPVLGEAVV